MGGAYAFSHCILFAIVLSGEPILGLAKDQRIIFGFFSGLLFFIICIVSGLGFLWKRAMLLGGIISQALAAAVCVSMLYREIAGDFRVVQTFLLLALIWWGHFYALRIYNTKFTTENNVKVII